MIDISREAFLLEEDLIDRRRELYDQMRFIVNELEKIDQIYGAGKYYLSESEARKLMRIPDRAEFPKSLPCVTFKHRTEHGNFINTRVYERQDIDKFMEERKK
mgnify:CR=1 FL=1